MDPDQQQLFQAPQEFRNLEPGKLPRHEDIVLTPEQIEEALAEPRWQQYTPNQRLSFYKGRIRLKIGHEIVVNPITGQRLIGGPQPGANPEKKRVDQELTAEAERRVQEIKDALFSALDPNRNDDWTRHKAALNIAKEAREIRRLEMDEEDREKLSGEALLRKAAELLAGAVQSGQLDPETLNAYAPSRIEDVVDADVVEA